MSFAASARAKINLTLDVGPGAADGYHSLRSVFLRLGFADRLAVAIDPSAASDSLAVDGPPDCPVEGNLVLAALELLRRRIAQPLPALRVRLAKRVPVGAGLGGGSSDAAAMLGLAEACWGVAISPAERLALALELGSDVPFFAAAAPAAVVEGRGERVTALPGVVGDAAVLLAVPATAMRTGQVFQRLDDLRRHAPAEPVASVTDALADALRGGLDGAGLAGWAERLRGANDLWPAARDIDPTLAELRDALEAASARPWLMSGSGSALLSLHPSTAEAESVGRRIGPPVARRFAGLMLVADNLHAADPAWRFP